ncbi:hypothetical protein GCM10009547_37920 [Sporichthya brevicatena]|uniref:IrrE N-terminal-like domain-containing protein n=1 Tax=Sporichthya brevicatena TaxID=171442 RepID=A0ABP3SEK8_9ACTN
MRCPHRLLLALLVAGVAVVPEPADATALASTPTAIPAVQRAVAEVAKLPLPPVPPLTVIEDPTLAAQGQVLDRTIWINTKADEASQARTVLHELGHVLDDSCGIDTGPVVAALRKTPTVRALIADSLNGDEWAQYAVADDEIFARGFGQFVVEQSGDPDLIEAVRSLERAQWPAEEFARVMPEFERLFGVWGHRGCGGVGLDVPAGAPEPVGRLEGRRVKKG